MPALTEIGAHAFAGCTGLMSVDASECNELRFAAQYGYEQFGRCNNLKLFSIGCPVPPAIGSGSIWVFTNAVADNATLKVPAGSVDAYKASDWADYFDNIVPLD